MQILNVKYQQVLTDVELYAEFTTLQVKITIAKHYNAEITTTYTAFVKSSAVFLFNFLLLCKQL